MVLSLARQEVAEIKTQSGKQAEEQTANGRQQTAEPEVFVYRLLSN